MINVTKKSILSGQENTLQIDMSEERYADAYARWKAGELVQNAFPNLTADEREFLMTGSTAEEWDALC